MKEVVGEREKQVERKKHRNKEGEREGVGRVRVEYTKTSRMRKYGD